MRACRAEEGSKRRSRVWVRVVSGAWGREEIEGREGILGGKMGRWCCVCSLLYVILSL